MFGGFTVVTPGAVGLWFLVLIVLAFVVFFCFFCLRRIE